MSTLKPLDPKIKEVRLLRRELLDLQQQILTATVGLLARLDAIDPPEQPYAGKPRTRKQAKAFFESFTH